MGGAESGWQSSDKNRTVFLVVLKILVKVGRFCNWFSRF
jgi:hypothetical protein